MGSDCKRCISIFSLNAFELSCKNCLATFRNVDEFEEHIQNVEKMQLICQDFPISENVSSSFIQENFLDCDVSFDGDRMEAKAICDASIGVTDTGYSYHKHTVTVYSFL